MEEADHIKKISTFASVKKIAVISFIFIFLCANTTFGQLLKFPVLVHHYLEHRNLNNESFADFLDEHYAKKINHADDLHHDHERMPFKTPDCNASQTNVMMPNQNLFSIQAPLVLVKASIFYTQQHYSSDKLNSIWQPPRFC